MGTLAGLLQVLCPRGKKGFHTNLSHSISQGATYLLLSSCQKPVILSSKLHVIIYALAAVTRLPNECYQIWMINSLGRLFLYFKIGVALTTGCWEMRGSFWVVTRIGVVGGGDSGYQDAVAEAKDVKCLANNRHSPAPNAKIVLVETHCTTIHEV